MGFEADLIAAGDRLFGRRGQLLELWQEIARNFNPAMADFDHSTQLGQDYAADLSTSYPLIVAREMTDVFSAMLRPSDRQWAFMESEDVKDHEGKEWIEWATGVQRRAMYDRAAQFVHATKEGDRAFGLFGQCVLSVDVMPDRSSLLYRSWNLRDVAWADGINNEVECVHRKWDTPTARDLARLFGERNLSPKVREHLRPGKDGYCVVPVRHCVIPADQYDGPVKFTTPLVSIYIDVENMHVIEATGQRVNPYVIPRWQRVQGTQYAISPATVCALPESRLLQAMTWTLLEAGEKATNPPMIGVQEAVRGDVDLRAGRISWVAADYDERTGAALRPLLQDKSGMPLGLEMQQRSEATLRQAMYLHKLDLPMTGEQMTAYEVSQRVQEYIRNALPLFEPVEFSYNGGLCERTFDVLAANGGFGSPDTWPESVRGADIDFRFVSPLRDAMDRRKADIFMQGAQMVSQAVALDPGAGAMLDATEALRDVLEGIGAPARWTRSREETQAIRDAQGRAAQAQQMLDGLAQASGIAKNLQGTTGGPQMPAMADAEAMA